MPVIINDLEIILEGQDRGTAEAPAAPAAPPGKSVGAMLAPKTLERVELHRRARAARIRAH